MRNITVYQYLLPRKKPHQQHGFTLLEIMIVIAIIGVLVTIAIINYKSHLKRLNYTTTITDLKHIDREITVYYIENNSYPLTLADIGLSDIKDPWGNSYRYLNISTVKGKGKLRKDHSLVPVNTDYDLYSMGPDGDSKSPFTAKASRDDIVRANDGTFFGRVSDY